MRQFTRILRHLWWDDRDTRRLIGAEALERLEARVQRSEQQHDGEIRLCLEGGLPWSYLRRGASPRERALAMFGKLQVWDTERNNGVLIYLLLAEHDVEIVADRGIHARAGAGAWEEIARRLAERLHAGEFEAGLAEAIDAVDALLRTHFPLAPGERSTNELPDTVVRL